MKRRLPVRVVGELLDHSSLARVGARGDRVAHGDDIAAVILDHPPRRAVDRVVELHEQFLNAPVPGAPQVLPLQVHLDVEFILLRLLVPHRRGGPIQQVRAGLLGPTRRGFHLRVVRFIRIVEGEQRIDDQFLDPSDPVVVEVLGADAGVGEVGVRVRALRPHQPAEMLDVGLGARVIPADLRFPVSP